MFLRVSYKLSFLGHRSLITNMNTNSGDKRVLKNIFKSTERSERVNIFQHEKRNFGSPSGHVMFHLLYKHSLRKAPCNHSNGDLFTCEDMCYFHV